MLAGSAPAAVAGSTSWAHQAGSLSSNGSVTVKSIAGGSYSATQNPSGAIAKANQVAATQPPTVIVQATASLPIKAVGDACTASTSGSSPNQAADEGTAITADRASLLTCQSGTWAKLGTGAGRYQCSAQLGSSVYQYCVDTQTGNVLQATNNGSLSTITMSNWPVGWDSSNTMCDSSIAPGGGTIYVACGSTVTAKRCYRNIWQSGGGAWSCSS